MSKATLTIEGFVAKDPELKYHDGRPVTNVTVAHTPRRLDKSSNEWVDAGPTLWVQASFWEQNAESIVAAVGKGTLVTITGHPEVRVFTKQDGTAEANLNLKFGTLGIIPRTPSTSPAVGRTQGAASDEPWSTPGSASGHVDAWPTPGSFGDDTPF